MRLGLHGSIVAIPPIANLTSLSLVVCQEDSIPKLTGFPLLHTQRLQLCKTLLPALEGPLQLSQIYLNVAKSRDNQLKPGQTTSQCL